MNEARVDEFDEQLPPCEVATECVLRDLYNLAPLSRQSWTGVGGPFFFFFEVEKR